MKKRVLATVLATVLMASTVLSGCGSDGQKETNAGSEEPAQEEDTGEGDSTQEDTAETQEEEGEASAASAVSHVEELPLEVYDVASNYQGLQSAWYGKIL